MEVVQQVRLLLWRNVALRIRQPVILALELLWPVVIFLVVMAARNAIPPVAQPTCHYRAWALPSAGVVPFVQSMICNIDDCQSQPQETPAYNGSSVRELVSVTAPLIMEEGITELVSALPKGMRLMRVAVDALSGPDLSALLGNGFPIKNLILDVNQTRDLLHQINVTKEEIDPVLESSIQLPQVLELTNLKNFCDSSEEEEDAGGGNAIGKLRQHLCRMDEVSRKGFFRQLKNQLDFKNIVQTMGLAMSELGRLDVGEMLGSIGGLLQSSDVLREDALHLLATLLDQVQLDRLDIQAMGHLIDDLEPLYRDSEWATLIRVLKDVKLPPLHHRSALQQQGERGFDSGKLVKPLQNEKKVTEVDASVGNQSSNSFLGKFLGLAETGFDILRFLPENVSSQAQSLTKYFTSLVDIGDTVVMETEKASKGSNSTKFLNSIGDILGALFLNIADETKPSNSLHTGRTSNLRLCDIPEFLKLVNSSDWNDVQSLQRLSCKISKRVEKMRSSSEPTDAETRQLAVGKLQRLLNPERYTDLLQNLLHWANETKENALSVKNDKEFSESLMVQDSSIDDLIRAVDCGTQNLKGVFFKEELSRENAEEGPSSLKNTPDSHLNNGESLLLHNLDKGKDLVRYFKSSVDLNEFSNKTDFTSILEELLKVMNAAGTRSYLAGTSSELFRFIPALVYFSKNFNANATLKEDFKSFLSDFIYDLETKIWNSITPKMVEDRSALASRHFCVEAAALNAEQLHWKWMLCSDPASPAFRIPILNKGSWEKKEKEASSAALSFTNSSGGVDHTQALTRTLLRVWSRAGLSLRLLSQFARPVGGGCEEGACGGGSQDPLLSRMCFLGRLQNVKKEMQQTGEEQSDVLKQLRPFVSIDDEVVENYDRFLSVMRSSAVNNYTDWKDIVQLGVSGLRFLNALDRKEHKLRPVFHVLNSLISLVKNRVSDAALTRTSPMVQIENVFPDSPLTQDVVRSLLPLLPEVLSTFFWTALAPAKVLNLVSSSEKNISTIMGKLCNSSLTDYLYNPSLSEEDFAELSHALCQHQFYDVFEEVFQDPDIQEIVFEASSTEDVSWEDMHENLLESVSLLLDLVRMRRADLSAFPPLSKWQGVALDLRAHALSPAVMLFVLNSKIFSPFCRSEASTNPSEPISKDLCSMSEPAFSKRLVLEASQGLQEGSKDAHAGAREVLGALARMPEVKGAVKELFGLELHEDVQEGGFVRRVLNASEKAFDMVDRMTKGGLSSVVLGSSLPEVMGDLAAFFYKPDGNLNYIHEKGASSEKTANLFSLTNPEKRRLGSYIGVLGNYFSTASNRQKLRFICDATKQNRTKELRVRQLTQVVCLHEPPRWPAQIGNLENHFTDIWTQIDEFFSGEIKNETQSLYFQERKRDILGSTEKLVISGVQSFNSSQYSSFYFYILRNLVKNLEEDSPFSEKVCLTNSGEIAIKTSTHKLLSSISEAHDLSCGLLNKNISGLYSWISKTADLKSVFLKLAEGKKNEEKCHNSWNWLLSLVDDMEGLYQKLSANYSEDELKAIQNCTRGFKESPLFTSLQLHINILKQTAEFVSTLYPPPGRWKKLKESIFERISQHLPAFFKISDVISEKSALVSTPEYKDELNKNLRESSINFNWVLRHGFSSSALSKKVCTVESSDAVFRSPSLATPRGRFQLVQFFCSEDAVHRLLQQMDQNGIRNKVLKVQEKEFFSANWLQELVSSSEALVDIGLHLKSSLAEIHIRDLYDVLNLFSRPHVVNNVVESFGKLKNVLEPVFPGSQLIETLQQIMDGLKSFTSLTKLADFSFKYTVREVFGERARSVLEDLQMDPQSIEEVMASEVDIKQAAIDKESGLVSFCEKDASSPSPYCLLSSKEETSVSSDHLQDLVFQRFLLSFGSLGIEGVLREADLDSKEAEKTLKSLSNAPAVANRLKELLHQVTLSMKPEVSQLFQKLDQGVDWLATPEALSVGGRVLCGKPLNSLSQKFMLLSPEDSENKVEDKELLRLPTEFCRHGYREIMKMRGGAILWGLLKPLFRGKILYAPKTYPPAVAIISKINETFQILEEQIKFVKAAAEGTSGLHYLQRKNETLRTLQTFLSSKVVSKFLGGAPSWGSALSWLEGGGGGAQPRSLLHLVELVGNVTECIVLDRFVGFDGEEELEAAAATLHDRREFIAAIVFMDENAKDDKEKKRRGSFEDILPENVKYKIRMDIDNVPTTEYIKYRWWRPYAYDDFFEDLRYFRGFLQLQDTVDEAIISLRTNRPQGPTKYLQQFPYPCHQRDKFGTLLKGSMPAVMTISWVFIVAFLVRERVLGRELELDETLQVMGLKPLSGWLAWLLTGLCVLLVSVAGIVAVLKWGGITPNSDPLILFLFVADFALLLIAYCQLMSTFFNRASTAALVSVLLYVLSFFPFLLFVTWELDFHYWQKLMSCGLVSTSFCFGCLYLNRYEDQGQGVHWNNLWHSPVAGDRMNFGTTLLAMVLCSLFYFLLSWYASKVQEGWKGKKPLAWYFLFREPPPLDTDSMNGTMKSKTFSTGEMKKRTVGLSLQNVHALYSRKGGKEWRALAGLNLDLYEDHITALLGHNGAGKTTTIKILTGRIQPTSGKVTLYGMPLSENLAEARKLIGFCPQNNTLYDKLTVREHLNLFARLKGVMDEASVEADVEEMVGRLQLEEKRDEVCERLSGGQRRRLCVGAAFVGGSRLVVLDEPTSSVDPVARRAIWDLVLSYRKGRTILFTTHHLDEADILSDRVAILHKGHLLCSGSPLELKGRFGSGFRLSLLLPSEHGERDSGRASSIDDEPPALGVHCDEVMDVIESLVPDATLLEQDESRLVVSLPADPLSAKPLSHLFALLEQRLPLWGFQGISLSSATLDEVFLTLCRLEDAKAAHNSDKFTDISPFRQKKYEATIVHLAEEVTMKKNSASAGVLEETRCLWLQQLRSLVLKRYWHVRRNWKALASSVLMPCLFIALAMGLAVGRPQKAPDPALELTPALYASPGHGAVSFFGWKNSLSDLGPTLLDFLNTNTSFSCDPNHPSPSEPHSPKRCLCDKECSSVTKPPTSCLQTPDQVLYNTSGTDVSRYLLDSYLQFNEKRYGGWTLEEATAKVWFENSGYHSAPSYLNTLNNAILRSQTGRDYGIRTWSHPLRLSVEQLGRETLLQRLGEVGISFVFLIGLSLVPCTFAVFLVGERRSEQRRLLRAHGLPSVLYWTAAALCDMAVVLITAAGAAAIVAAVGLPAFYQRDNFRALCLLVFLYGWSTTPLTYACAGLFPEGSLAFMVLFTSHLFVGLVIMLALVSLRMISISKDVAWTLSLLQRVSLLFPQYGLVGGLTDLHENQIRADVFAQFGQDAYASPLTFLAPHFAALAAVGAAALLLTLLLDALPTCYSRLMVRSPKPKINAKLPPDDGSKHLLQIQNVSRVYRTKAGNKYAVDNLTLSIPEGECFGLVGANGAGKTTLFRMLIGEIQPTAGKIISVGLQSKRRKEHQFLGYCPQKDALDGLLTPRQHLVVYAGLRGIATNSIPKVVEQSLRSLELETHADRPVHTLSGGTKRKLCTAIATLGDPQLILLDEPTSGMDPATRRLVWKCISRATEDGRSVILTSHSIEDCDILCSRLGIMVNGRLACLDSPTRLKARLGTGYTLSFRIPESKETFPSLLEFIRKEIPSAVLQIHSGRRVELSLPDESMTLSSLFCQLEECAKRFGIEDLAVDPTTLDQVFVNFVRQQSDDVQEEQHRTQTNLSVPIQDHVEVCCTKL